MSGEPTISEIVIEEMRLCALTNVSTELIARGLNGAALKLAVDALVRNLEGRLTLRATATVAAVPQTIEHVYLPADWWQAFRERWAPRWWLERHPVRTRAIPTRRVHVCPHIALRTPEDMHFAFLAGVPCHPEKA